MAGLEESVRMLDPASRALLDLSLRRRLHDDDMAPVLRLDPFNIAWRRARAIERIASHLGLDDPYGIAQVRAALPWVPQRAWGVPLAIEPAPRVEVVEHSATIVPHPGAPPAPRPAAERVRAAVSTARHGNPAGARAAARGALLAAGGAVLGAVLSRRRRRF
jgi:hypothetical protein